MRNKQRMLVGLLVLTPLASLNPTISSTGPTPTDATLEWNKTAYSPASGLTVPALFVGSSAQATTVANQTYALARTEQAIDLTTGNVVVAVSAIAPVQTTLNDQANAANPLNNAVIANLVLQPDAAGLPRYSVVTVNAPSTKVYEVLPNATNVIDGSFVRTNDDGNAPSNVPLQDAAGAASKDVRALTASSDYIFAAVTEMNQDWKTPLGANRGIAVLQRGDTAADGLVVKNAPDFGAVGNAAVKLSVGATADNLNPRGPVAFFDNAAALGTTIASAELANNVDLFWNPNVERLYVGLNNAKRDDFNKEGGVFGLAMGVIDPTAGTGGLPTLSLTPVINNVTKAVLYDGTAPASGNVADRVVGFYFDGVNPAGGNFANNGSADVNVSINQIRTMFTSTNKDYLIVNGSINVPLVGQTRGVYALGIWPADDANPDKVGTLVKVDGGVADFGNVPVKLSEMPKATDDAVNVSEAINTTNLTNVFVEGDTVYMCLDGVGAQSGMFAATAIFDQDGSIKSWTSPKRVYGHLDKVYGAGLDTNVTSATVGDFYALTADRAAPNQQNTLRITQWGKSDVATANDAPVNNLSSLLETLFPVEKGGIVSYHSFGPATPGFDPVGRFGMDVAVGVDQIALIQTITLNGLVQELVTNFVVDTNVFVFKASEIPALAAIAPLTCAEVSRMTGDNEGWLFVGGCNGCAVLSNNTDSSADVNADGPPVSPPGRGFGSRSVGVGASGGLRNLQAAAVGVDAYPKGTNWTFKKLVEQNNPGTFVEVLKLIASNGVLYVTTLHGIYFFDMEAEKFDAAATNPLNETVVSGSDQGALIADLVVLSKNAVSTDDRGVIATNFGIFASDFANDPVFVQKVDDIALQLQAVGDRNNNSQQTSSPTNANILALATDFSNNNDKLYRFFADANQAKVANIVKPVSVPFADGNVIEFNSSEQSSFSDGSFVFATLPKNFDQVEFVTVRAVDNPTAPADITPLLDVDTMENSYVRPVAIDEASGVRLVPGDWGVRVNE